jgi:hypothetical protein
MLRRQQNAYFWVFLFAGILLLGGCEKDDICVDGDTPLFVIGFFDVTDTEQTTEKDVSSLRIREISREDFPPSFTDRSTTDSVALPLPTNASTVTYILISNSATTNEVETGNIDTLDVTYTLSERFVSRACGFVAVYDEITVSVRPDADNWIQDLVLVDTLVEFNNRIHLKALH